MPSGRKKVSKVVILMILLACMLTGYYIGAIIHTAANMGFHSIYDLDKLQDAIAIVKNSPFANYLSKYTGITLLVFLFIWIILAALYIENSKTYMPGAEYGTAKWGDVKKISKKLADKEKCKNKILSAKLKMGIDDRVTRLNANTVYDGGSGSGKSAFAVLPNLYQFNGSYIITDPKGDILKKNGKLVFKEGYDLKVLNFCNMLESNCYNPFPYIREEEDIARLVTNLIANTTPKTAVSGDPFWEKAEKLYLQALMCLSWLEGKEKSFNEVLDYMSMSNVDDDGEASELDLIINQLEAEKGSNHPAVVKYRQAFKGAADTIRSIIMCANSRLEFMNTPKVRRILSCNDLKFSDLGFGVNKDGKTKTALFFVIPANDKTYNSIIGMAYTQMFQELYYQAERATEDVRLPIPVQVWMDEFANISLPDNFTNILSTCRSYGISINVIIQNIAQLKALFKDEWESIIGNCDSFVYLGGNEQSTHKYVSEMLGKWTVDKRSRSKSYGSMSGSSISNDVIGRDLMDPTEVRKMSRRKCITFIAGEDPVIDNKYFTFKKKKYLQSKVLGEYKHIIEIKKDESGCYKFPEQKEPLEFEIIPQGSLEYYKGIAEKDDTVKIYEFNAADLFYYGFESNENITDVSLDRLQELLINSQDKLDEIEEIEEKEEKELNNKLGKINYDESLLEILSKIDFDDEQYKQITLGLEHGLSEDQIKSYLRLDYTGRQMEVFRLLIEKEQNAV